MDASQLPKGKSMEVTTDGRPLNLPGKYLHKPTGVIYITPNGEEGVVHADALMAPVWKDGWEYVAEVPTRLELLEMRKAQQVKDATEEALEKGREAEELKQATKAAIDAAKAAQEAEVAVK